MVPGYERFLLPSTFPGIVADAGGDPLVYLGATEAGGFALIVRPAGAAAEAVWLPGLTDEALAGAALWDFCGYTLKVFGGSRSWH